MLKDIAKNPDVAELATTLHALRAGVRGKVGSGKAQPGALIKILAAFPGHYLYIYNYRKGRITHHQGFGEVLGYADDEVSIGTLYHAFHPEDAPALAMLTEQMIGAMSRISNAHDPLGLAWMVDYRVRRKDGQYIKVLRQSMVFEVGPANDEVISTINLCKAISAEHTGHTIGWRILGPTMVDLDHHKLASMQPKLQYRPSMRELEVVRELAKGKSSKEIAVALSISVLTVSTHRRNLLGRTGTHNTPELVHQAMERGWL
ncbi:MAG TPA: LuxR C-terminal-related transcriptional regulator [Flavobacteriales bacterium]|nr:LuxR C-terminal-related transcriptional regulator [Flavobacteriales bacterium]